LLQIVLVDCPDLAATTDRRAGADWLCLWRQALLATVIQTWLTRAASVADVAMLVVALGIR
jgi:hypothetical protein